SRHTRAANTARSAQSRCGRGSVRRRTATPCRSTTSDGEGDGLNPACCGTDLVADVRELAPELLGGRRAAVRHAVGGNGLAAAYAGLRRTSAAIVGAGGQLGIDDILQHEELDVLGGGRVYAGRTRGSPRSSAPRHDVSDCPPPAVPVRMQARASPLAPERVDR